MASGGAARGDRPTSLAGVISEVSRHAWSTTGIGGLSHAHGARLPPLRLLWLGLFVAGLTMTANDVRGVVDEFLLYPHVTKTEARYAVAIPFPAVTVCNQNQVDCLRLLQHSLDARHEATLRRVLLLSGCLSKGALSCKTVWTTLAGAVSQQWGSGTRPHCLEMNKCTHLAEFIRKRNEDNLPTDGLDSVFYQIGCSSSVSEGSPGPGKDDNSRGSPTDALAVTEPEADITRGNDSMVDESPTTDGGPTTGGDTSGRNGTVPENTATESAAVGGGDTNLGEGDAMSDNTTIGDDVARDNSTMSEETPRGDDRENNNTTEGNVTTVGETISRSGTVTTSGTSPADATVEADSTTGEATTATVTTTDDSGPTDHEIADAAITFSHSTMPGDATTENNIPTGVSTGDLAGDEGDGTEENLGGHPAVTEVTILPELHENGIMTLNNTIHH